MKQTDQLQPSDFRLFFLHIPKTAGTTFQHILQRIYQCRSRKVALYLVPKILETLTQEEKTELDVVGGHLPYGVHRFFPGRRARYVTFLRDPVERCISYYFHILRCPDNYLHNTVAQGRMPLEDFAVSPASVEMDNLQCRLISGIAEDVPIGGLDENCLKLAQQRLREDFEVVGLTERFDESLFDVALRFDWEGVRGKKMDDFLYKKANVGENKIPKLKDKRLIRLVREQNKFDVQLYEYAQELFARRMRALRAPYFFFRARKLLRPYYRSGRRLLGVMRNRIAGV